MLVGRVGVSLRVLVSAFLDEHPIWLSLGASNEADASRGLAAGAAHFHGNGDSGNQAASAYGNGHVEIVRELIERLEADGAVAGAIHFRRAYNSQLSLPGRLRR